MDCQPSVSPVPHTAPLYRLPAVARCLLFCADMNQRADIRGERGVGFAECAAALLVLAVGALAGMELVVLSARAGDALQRAAAANSLLAGRLDQLQSLSFDDPALSPGGSLTFPRPGFSEEVSLDGRVWRIYRQVSLQGSHEKLITLRVVGADEGERRPGARLSAMVCR